MKARKPCLVRLDQKVRKYGSVEQQIRQASFPDQTPDAHVTGLLSRSFALRRCRGLKSNRALCCLLCTLGSSDSASLGFSSWLTQSTPSTSCSKSRPDLSRMPDLPPDFFFSHFLQTSSLGCETKLASQHSCSWWNRWHKIAESTCHGGCSYKYCVFCRIHGHSTDFLKIAFVQTLPARIRSLGWRLAPQGC